MRRVLSEMLVGLVLVVYISSMAPLNVLVHELDQRPSITSARTGADPSVVAITSPKETVCDINGCRNALEVGQATTFSAYIQNAGEAAADDLSYTVTVHLTDGQGNVGFIATDSNGNDLRWENLDAMCDDGTVCDFDTTATPHPFGAGAYLGGGKLTLTKNGAPIEWTPAQGQYIVMIEVDSSSDADIANNVEQVYVEVNDWYDIEVDLSWDNEVRDNVHVQGTETFSLDVTATGSATFEPRNVMVRLEISGDVDAAQASIEGNNVDLLQNAGITVLEVGDTQSVRTYENETDPSNITESFRKVLEYESTWSVQVSITPTSDNDALFFVKAELINYTVFGQYDDCIEVFDNSDEGGEENITVWNHFCEVTLTEDNLPGTDHDEIGGTKDKIHDIAIGSVGVYQGYNSDGTGLPSSFVESGNGDDLSVGVSYLYAEVIHRGSHTNTNYGWHVMYTVTKDGTQVATGTVNNCTGALEIDYLFAPLGAQSGASLSGFVCVQVQLVPAEYEFEFTLAMDAQSNSAASVPWTGATDDRTVNNEARMVADVINNLPIITSFELLTEGDLVVGVENLLEFSVHAFDLDDPFGAGLDFTYSSQHGEFPGCGGLISEGGTLCSTQLTSQFVGDLAANVAVTDAHGGTVSESMIVEVWNAAVATATSEAGIEISYALQYRGIDAFTITTFEDMEITREYTGVELENYAGTYDAVAVIDYVPSTTRSAADVLTQSLSVTAPNSLEATSMWYVGGNGLWALMDDVADEAGPTASEFTFTFPANSGMLPAGTIVLMGGEIAQATVPDATVSDFAATALKSGAIGVTWAITGTLLSSDSIVVGICEDTADCAEPFETTVADEDRAFKYGGASTTHGTTYHVAVAVCNEEGCSAEGRGSVVADKAVDGDVVATLLNIVQDGDNWIVTWDIEGSTADVAMWHVCYQRGEPFTAAEMPTECPDSVMGADATTLTIAMPTAAGSFTYYFTAVPMDALGNMDAQGQMNSIDYFREAPEPKVVDSDGDGVEDEVDAFPNDATQWADRDGDGYGDNPNGSNADAFPNNPEQHSDRDGDGFGDEPNGTQADAFPNDATQWADRDGDGYGDNLLGNNPDQYPNDPSEHADSDGDGVADNSDAFPLNPDEVSDSDGDGMGDNEQRALEQRLREELEQQAANRRQVIGLSGGLVLLAAGVFFARSIIKREPDEIDVDEEKIWQTEEIQREEETFGRVSQPIGPPRHAKGSMYEGYEIIEFPADSGTWYYKDDSTGQWLDWR